MVANSINLKDDLVKEFIESSFSKEAYAVLLCLKKEGKTDEMISKKLGLKVNEIRAFLNQLHYAGIIYYTKEKAKDSNWYTYTWFIKKERIAELLDERYEEELEKLKKQLDFESTYTFFKCSKGCSKLPFELAFEYDFKCPECGSVMKSFNNEKEKKRLRDKIRLIEKFLEKEKEVKRVNQEKLKKERIEKQKFEEEKKIKKSKKEKEKKKKKVNVKKVKKKKVKKRGNGSLKKNTKKKVKKAVVVRKKKKVSSKIVVKKNKAKKKVVKKKSRVHKK